MIPSSDDSKVLLSFDGDKSQLGSAEKFSLMITSIPKIQFRLQTMLLKYTFESEVFICASFIQSIY